MVDFSQVEIGSLEESPASPQVDFEKFTGVKIAMPTLLQPGETEPVPICATWVLPEAVEWRYKNIEDSFVYLIRNVKTHESFTGTFRFHENVENDPDPAGEFVPDEEDPNAKAMGWFNVDLGRVWKIPDEAGQYRIQVVLDEYQSNIVEFELKEPEP